MYKSTAEIRQAFLNFFHSKSHKIIASQSLVPNNDMTLLFTNAGMNQFKNIFLGLENHTYSRVTTSQRCLRVGGKHNDLENVGYTERHHTFFEMLGNFSFGDYFKQEAIAYAWELLTGADWFHIPKEKLWITVYETDDEAFDIWKKNICVPTERIIRIGDNKGATFSSDNFWQMGDTGPCGPCTEIFYDHGEHIFGSPPGRAEIDGDRYIEIWNIVFIQFNRQSDGSMLPLQKTAVDTGMGLERISAVLQHVSSNYRIDLFRNLIAAVSEVTGSSDLDNKSIRVIADHIRASAFLIADGVMPSNENRGYVLRRIIRRAIRHGSILGAQHTFFYKLVAPLIKVMGSTAKALKRQQSLIEQILQTEEEQFARTLERGLKLLDHELSALQGNILEGTAAFRLYDTFGLPIDLTADVCRERGLKIDRIGFEKALEAQRHRARALGNFRTDYSAIMHVNGGSWFRGYDYEECQAIVIALFQDGQSVEKIHFGKEAIVVLNETPFYAESGGQIGDKGWIKKDGIDFLVNDTQKCGQCIGHTGTLSQGSLKVKDRVHAKINTEFRNQIRLNHSATHLLHAALRQTLGDHVIQKGSLINEKYLRFDFSHFEVTKPGQIRRVEDLVNYQIRRNLLVQTEVLSLKDAKKKGALALFGEKYDDSVRMLTMGNFSTELCGGTHVNRTGDIGLFRILTECGTGAGVRRVEATTGEAAIAKLHQQSDLLQSVANLIKSDTNNLVDKLHTTLEHTRMLEKELQKLKNHRVAQESLFLSRQAKTIGETKLLISQLGTIEEKMLKIMVNHLKNQLGSSIIILTTTIRDKAILIAGVTQDLTDRINAKELIVNVLEQTGGKGGGRLDMAQLIVTNSHIFSKVLSGLEAWVTSRLLLSK